MIGRRIRRSVGCAAGAYFQKFSPAGYALGVNIVLYAMTH
jgi:hypothetical protein